MERPIVASFAVSVAPLDRAIGVPPGAAGRCMVERCRGGQPITQPLPHDKPKQNRSRIRPRPDIGNGSSVLSLQSPYRRRSTSSGGRADASFPQARSTCSESLMHEGKGLGGALPGRMLHAACNQVVEPDPVGSGA